jgi:radical SAM protein with 4Fe4S-binding SPASM domain
MLHALRYWFYRFKYHNGKDLPLTTPVDVSLELASECNMKCSYCYHADENKEHLPFTKGVMAYSVAKSIIRQSANLGVNSLKFNWKGESTINPDFARITGLAKSLARGSTFLDRLTNSNFKFRTDREDIFEGLSNQTKVKISYDSFRKDVFENQRLGGDHAITTRNIDKFYNHPLRRLSETQMVIQAVRTIRNKDEDIEGEAKKRWPEATISIRDMVGGRLEKDVSDVAVRVRDASERQSCEQAHVRLLFNWKGDAYPCCPDIAEKLKIGSIDTMSVRDIFNSVEAKVLRKDLKSGRAFEMDPCRGCSSFETFKGFKPVWNS